MSRSHILLQNLATAEASRAQLGLAHSYSRAKVKFNVNRQDNMIIQVRRFPFANAEIAQRMYAALF